MTKKRIDPPRRQRDARQDGKVGPLERSIERTHGLPKGSVKIVNPGGGDARSDKSIGRLKKDYGEG